MDELDRAAQILDRLRITLETELVQARSQRLLIRTLDAPGLFERARQRSAFNAQLAQLEQALGETLEAAGRALGLQRVTLADLRLALPEASQRLDNGMAEVRSLASALRETDMLNQKLGERALRRLRGHLSALTPRTVAYDRRGALAPMEALSTSRRVA
jgi:glutathione S-transferase